MRNKGFVLLPLLIVAVFVMVFISAYLYLKLPQEKPEVVQNLQRKLSIKSIEEQAQAVAEVAITKEGFTPQTISLFVGQQVTFVNKNINAHRVMPFPKSAINNLPQLDSEELQPTDSFTYSFEKIGTFTIADSRHPDKYKLTVIVQ